jgi:hypothetical protein
MSIKKIDVKQKENVIEVYVELNERDDRRGHPKMSLNTHNILEFLKNKNISHGNNIHEESLKNWHPQLLSGTWIFKKKTVDKPKKQVILKEEKPKTTQRRRTKKISTEE